MAEEDKPEIILIFSPSYKNTKQLLFKHDHMWLWAVNGSQATLACSSTNNPRPRFVPVVYFVPWYFRAVNTDGLLF